MSLIDEPVWLGIDVGTQSVRVLAVSAAGRIAGAGAAKLGSKRVAERHEQDPREWLHALAEASRQALHDVAPAAIRGLAVDATSGTILLTNGDGDPLTPGLMYDDTRAASEAQKVNLAGAEVWSALGYNRMQAAWGLPKLLWLVGNHPELIAPDARLAHQSDFINCWLVGGPVSSDPSNALKTGYDLLGGAWPHDVLARLGIPLKLLPSVALSGAPIGEVGADAAAATGIPAGTTVYAGMTDGCASQLASGALGRGSWNSVLGTTLVLKGVSPVPIKDPNGVVYSHRSPDGQWLPGGASSTGAGVIEKHFAGRDLDALTAQAATREPASVVAYPLAGRGERFPFYASEADGFVIGSPADEADHFAALLQGIGFIERLCGDYLDLLGAPLGGEWRLTGGTAKNRYWCQLRADILGRAVTIPSQAEPAVGMAILAASAGRSLAETARGMVSIREVIEPRAESVARFHAPYLRLVDELEKRGWISTDLARHSQRRSGTSG